MTLSAIVQPKTQMMTDRSGFHGASRPAAGRRHHSPALSKSVSHDAGQNIARWRREKALAQEGELLRRLMDAVPDAIYVKDTESRFVLANLGLARLLGAAGPEELYGKTDLDFCPTDLARKAIADERPLVHAGQPRIDREGP